MRVSFDSKGDFKNALNWLNKVQEGSPTATLQQIAKSGEQALAAGTPRATGATASGWSSRITSNGDVSEIAWTNRAHPEAGVSIAKLIELGHGTRTGGYVPPKPYIKQAMEPVWNSTDRMVKELIK